MIRGSEGYVDVGDNVVDTAGEPKAAPPPLNSAVLEKILDDASSDWRGQSSLSAQVVIADAYADYKTRMGETLGRADDPGREFRAAVVEAMGRRGFAHDAEEQKFRREIAWTMEDVGVAVAGKIKYLIAAAIVVTVFLFLL